ncbi:transporter [uncultured Actinomyces sp.]|uniref:transporter n=1 Tax=uncultured Actinomyces sp. TaxID=249061 RepID=UPI00288C159E|nr:transporter [uncultured Actinomyces sp.]
MVATLVRLKWRLTLNSLKNNIWALIGTAVGTLYGLGLLLALVAGAIGLGRLGADTAAPVLAAAGALTVLGWTLVPLMLTGVDSTLDPRAMAAWTAPSRPLVIGLAVAAATGVPGLFTGAGLLLPVLVWAVAGQWGAALLALALAPAALATCVLLSRVVVIGAGVSTSRRGRDRAGVIAVLAVFLVSLAPSLLNLGARLDSGIGPQGLRTAARVAGLTPFGWALAAPGHLARGEAVAAIGLAAAALALPAALAPVWGRVVGRVMTGPARSDARSRAYDGAAEGGAQAGAGGGGAGAAAGAARVLPWHRRLERIMPSPAAAVAARCLRYWRTDPRYLVQVITLVVMPVLTPVMIALGRASAIDVGETSLAPGRASAVLLAAPALAALLCGWGLHNDLAFDSTALWTQVSASVRGRDDRLGRLAAAALWQGPVIAVLALVGGAWTGLWHALPAVGGLSAAIYGCALAWSSLTSALLPYEANAPGDSPMKSRTSGTAFLAALVQMVGMGVICLAAAPVVAGFTAAALAGAWDWGWPLLAGGALWGAGAAWAGVVVGGRLLDSRGVRILTAIRSWPGHEQAR